MRTTSLNLDVRAAILAQVPAHLHSRIHVVASSVNARTRRCSWTTPRLDNHDVVVCAVCLASQPTGQAYVVPAKICPSVLELRPGDVRSKWAVYWVESFDMLDVAVTGLFETSQTSPGLDGDFALMRNKVLKELTP